MFLKVFALFCICFLSEVLCGTPPLPPPVPKKNFTGEYTLKFVFDPEWIDCFAYKIKKTNFKKNADFESRQDCYNNIKIEYDPYKCQGVSAKQSANYTLNKGVKVDKSKGVECDQVTCPKGYECSVGFGKKDQKPYTNCCSTEQKKLYLDAFVEKKCPGGADADLVEERGAMQTFVPIVGHNCNDFICHEGFKCVQLNKHFAKCCKA
ncbi:hypothetical protein L596_012398 [Steinernema carpocapsae]|uniref:BPTI/Kunitz inhibitor domain-containing protein n=1 Tax=Steinernema carpocapsae TaxID=34508 RepID=A0A4U5NX63_STECR|nr:hypothetical protein L596_012398 [Steinernema carpocapsae]